MKPECDSSGEFLTSVILIGGKMIGPGVIDRDETDSHVIWLVVESSGLVTGHGPLLRTEYQIPISNVLYTRREYIDTREKTDDK